MIARRGLIAGAVASASAVPLERARPRPADRILKGKPAAIRLRAGGVLAR